MKTKLNHEIISLFLRKLGWKVLPSNRSAIDVFIEPDTEDPLEIFLPNTNVSGYKEKLNDAVRVLSFSIGDNEDAVARSIYGFDKDLHNYRIEKSPPEGAPVALVHSLVGATKFMLHDASRYHSKNTYHQLSNKEKKNTKSPTEESALFVKQCNFLHTWRGSFGITIETPLWLPSLGLFPNVPDTLGRKTTKLILKGFNLVNSAIEKESSDVIIDSIDNAGEFLIFKQFPELLESIKSNNIEYSASTSPIIKLDESYKPSSKIKINEKSLGYIEKAVDQLVISEQTETISVVGFPETIKTTKEGILTPDTIEGERKVIVRGTSKTIGHVALPMFLSLEDYKKAIRAQDGAKDVQVICKVKKKQRGWEVLKVITFSPID